MMEGMETVKWRASSTIQYLEVSTKYVPGTVLDMGVWQ